LRTNHFGQTCHSEIKKVIRTLRRDRCVGRMCGLERSPIRRLLLLSAPAAQNGTIPLMLSDSANNLSADAKTAMRELFARDWQRQPRQQQVVSAASAMTVPQQSNFAPGVGCTATSTLARPACLAATRTGRPPAPCPPTPGRASFVEEAGKSSVLHQCFISASLVLWGSPLSTSPRSLCRWISPGQPAPHIPRRQRGAAAQRGRWAAVADIPAAAPRRAPRRPCPE
jgi:hypothetical protein